MATESGHQIRAKGRREPAVYGIAGWCVRGWLGLFGRPIRMLGADRLPDSAAILRVCHATSFTDAIALTMASPRPVTFLVARRHLGASRSVLASSLGMVCYETDSVHWQAALRTCSRVLASGGVLAEFQDAERNKDDAQRRGAPLSLAEEAWSSAFPDATPIVLPVHRFRPLGRDQEILMRLSEPISPRETGTKEAAPAPQFENAFMLDPLILKRLLGDVEQVLRDQLREEWEGRPVRKQNVDGFRLSPGAAETLRRTNNSEPEVLLELRQLLQAEREARRQCSLADLRAQLGRKQMSAFWRLLTWVETVAGLPGALYGAVNHAVAGLFLAVFSLAWRAKRAQTWTWLVRALIVLACYSGQTILVDHFWGRATAGYYAVTLPFSGAYLWRYTWLVRRRTHILLLGARSATLLALGEKHRKRLLARLRAVLDEPLERKQTFASR